MPVTGGIRGAEVVVSCADFDETLSFLRQRLGLAVEAIFPADSPAVAVLAGHGVRLRLERDGSHPPPVLRLACDDPAAVGGGATALVAPNGMRIELVEANPTVPLPALVPSLTVTRMVVGTGWGQGRAGMQYRDLIPDRQGGRFIASHIRILDAGPVPDYVHYHRVRFQMIYCYRGWVRVVYEDQGPPFVMRAGDCVLQPPEIRHRVLEASAGLEVIEIGCPAEHPTHVDHALELPTAAVRAERDFGGQRFVRHEAAGSRWDLWRLAGFEARDTGIGPATGGLAGARVVRRRGRAHARSLRHRGELALAFVLEGSMTLVAGGESHALGAGDAFTIPAGMPHALTEVSGDLELLDVTVPAALPVSG